MASLHHGLAVGGKSIDPAITSKHADRTSTRNKPRKTFTGCWTCRRRHVKCDEQHPACRRCLSGKFTCAGYGVRLTWVDKTREPIGNRRSYARRRIDSSITNNVTSPSNEGFPAQESISTFSGDMNDASNTNFISGAPFQHNTKSGSKPSLDSQNDSNHLIPTGLDTEICWPAEALLNYESSSLNWNLITPERDGVMTPSFHLLPDESTFAATDSSILGSFDTYLNDFVDDGLSAAEETFTSQATPTVSRAQFSPTNSQVLINDTSNQEEPLSNILWESNLRIHKTHLDVLPASTKQRNLINHWATNLCQKVMPIRSLSNPFLSVVSPIALEGSRMSQDQSSSTVALFHAVCAASATHLANLQGTSPELDELALQHARQSYFHLLGNISSTSLNERIASLGTICIWLLTNFISGTPVAWRALVRMARSLLEQIPLEVWNQSSAASLTYQCYAIFFNLIQSQYIGYQEFPGSLITDFAGMNLINEQGIPAQSLELISSFNAKLSRGELVDPSELDRLEVEFALSTPPLLDNMSTHAKNKESLQHHNYLFYHASLLYFKCNSGRRDCEDDIQALVEKCIEHIEYLDTAQADSTPRTWIYATVAFEAGTTELRNRIRTSFNHKKSLAFATWDKLLLAAEEIWRIRDQTLPGNILESWSQIVARQPHLDLLWY